jgi:hypothetical protein
MDGHVSMTAMIQKFFDMKSGIARSSHPRNILLRRSLVSRPATLGELFGRSVYSWKPLREQKESGTKQNHRDSPKRGRVIGCTPFTEVFL